MKKWLIVVLSVAWLVWELVAAFDPYPSTWPLTQIVITYVPVWIYMPAALILAAWLPWHFWSNRKRKAASPAPLLAAPEVAVPKLDLANLARYNKFYVAAATAGLEAAQTALPLTPLEHGWVTIILAALGAGTVLAVPNKPAPNPAPPTA